MITCPVLVTQDQGSSGEHSQAGRKLPQTEGKMVYVLIHCSARFSFASLSISGRGENFHCASALFTAWKRRAQNHLAAE